MMDKENFENEFENEFNGNLELQQQTTEISGALVALSGTADDAEVFESQEKDDLAEKRNESKLKFARKIANGAISGIDSALDTFLQCNTGLTQAERSGFCADFAPMLVRMGVTDYKSFLDGYGCYVMGAVAVFKLGLKITRNVNAQLMQKITEQKEPAAHEVGGLQQDFRGEGKY